MGEVDWFRYPLVRDSDCGRRWLQIQSDLGLAKNTVEAYARGLDGYLRFLRDLEMNPTECNREVIASFIRSLMVQPGATRGKVTSIRAKAVLSNATFAATIDDGQALLRFSGGRTALREKSCRKRPLHSRESIWFDEPARPGPTLRHTAVDSNRGGVAEHPSGGADETDACAANVCTGLRCSSPPRGTVLDRNGGYRSRASNGSDSCGGDQKPIGTSCALLDPHELSVSELSRREAAPRHGTGTSVPVFIAPESWQTAVVLDVVEDRSGNCDRIRCESFDAPHIASLAAHRLGARRLGCTRDCDFCRTPQHSDDTWIHPSQWPRIGRKA